MAKVIYSMQTSLDGFIAGPDDDIRWSVPDEEVHRFHNEQASEVGLEIYGRRLYETMRFWETAEDDQSLAAHELEFARIWKQIPKLVFSTTLAEVGPLYTLKRTGLEDEVARLRAEPGPDIGVGGAALAAGLIESGLVDELKVFIYPVVLGGGTPYLPALSEPLELEPIEARRFGSGVQYLRYAAIMPGSS